jgi:hypothetical protein
MRRIQMKTKLMIATAICLASGIAQAQSVKSTSFELSPNPAFLACLAADGQNVQADVKVRRGDLNDRLVLDVWGLKPNLAFDLFTVQRTSLGSDGKPDPSFPGSFGLAWYQSDVQADSNGNARVVIQTILLDQIFGFDADKNADGTVKVPPTNTFHLGFWFNNPDDAAPCGFDTTKPTPFNGEHKAGPLAMISTPTQSGLGPLCTSPTGADPSDTSALPCNP